MRNLVFGILVASTATLGFFAYQSSRKVVALEADLSAKAQVVASLEAEKTALVTEVATLQSQMAEMVTAASDAAAPGVNNLADSIGDEISAAGDEIAVEPSTTP